MECWTPGTSTIIDEGAEADAEKDCVEESGIEPVSGTLLDQ
jgi:hypothetical protein